MGVDKVLKVDLSGALDDGVLDGGPDGTLLFGDSDLPIPSEGDDGEGLTPGASLVKGDALWRYRYENRINGIPVTENDRDLLIGTEKILEEAFELHGTPKSWMKWMAPEIQESADEYAELLRRQGCGEIRILGELTQYDTDKKAYLIWVRYEELEYRLSKRYDFIRSNKND